MKIKCLIVDDEPLARNLLADYIQKIPFLTLDGSFSNPLEAMDKANSDASIDLLFLDIQMPEITGIDLLKAMNKKPLVILTTAYSEYAIEGYEQDVLDYLLKPITFERFLKAAEKARSRLIVPHKGATEKIIASPSKEYIFVKDGTRLIKINFSNILYVEGMKDYVAIHTKDKKIVSLQRLKMLENQLPSDQFIRIHHSYIIAFDKIDTIYKDKVQIGSKSIPISASYRQVFKDIINQNFIQPE